MKPFLRLCAVALMACACLRPAAAAEPQPGAGKTVLMVVRMEGKSLPIDKQIAAHLETRGYAVTLYDQSQPTERAKAFDLVVLSSTVRSRDLLGAYRNVPVPLVTWENDLLDDMAMTGKRRDVDFGMVDKEHYLWMVNAPHPLSAGLPAGVAVGYAKDAPMGWASRAWARISSPRCRAIRPRPSSSATRRARRWTTRRSPRRAACSSSSTTRPSPT